MADEPVGLRYSFENSEGQYNMTSLQTTFDNDL